jgi:hypothetical protein
MKNCHWERALLSLLRIPSVAMYVVHDDECAGCERIGHERGDLVGERCDLVDVRYDLVGERCDSVDVR